MESKSLNDNINMFDHPGFMIGLIMMIVIGALLFSLLTALKASPSLLAFILYPYWILSFIALIWWFPDKSEIGRLCPYVSYMFRSFRSRKKNTISIMNGSAMIIMSACGLFVLVLDSVILFNIVEFSIQELSYLSSLALFLFWLFISSSSMICFMIVFTEIWKLEKHK